jgi:leucyl aminopeptidase (aminopeptidase T)
MTDRLKTGFLRIPDMSLASSVVNDCLRITEKDNVTVLLYPHNLPLAEDIAEECFKNGADVLLNLYTDRYLVSYHDQLSVENLRRPSVFCRALTENSTAEIYLAGTYDPAVLRKIAPEKNAAAAEGESKAHYPLSKEKKMRSLSIGLALVTKPRAKVYGFNYERWRRMMQAATTVDYPKLAKTGKALMNSLQDAKSITVTGPAGTSLSFDISGRRWRLSDGVVDKEDVQNESFDDEIPAGQLYVAPLEDSARGVVTFNTSTPTMGTNVTGLHLGFKDGRVTQFSGDRNTIRLKKDWESGTGDKDRIAYFGIGFNPSAETGYTVNTVANGAVSIGIGGNEFFGGKNKSGFFHLGTLTGATVVADGKTILRKGKIVRP